MLIIDRFEGDYAVCEEEDGSPRNIHLSHLPWGAKAGDVLKITDGAIMPDAEETERRRAAAKKTLEDLWE